MKKLTAALVLCGILTLCLCPATTRADSLGDKIKAFNTRIETQLQKVVAYVKAYYHSPQVQTRIAEIKAEQKAVVKVVLTAIYNRWLEFQTTVLPIIDAKIEMAILKVEAKIVDGLKIFKTQASAAYEKAVARLIARLPANLQAQVNAIRNSASYQAKKAEVAQKIMDFLVKKINEGEVVFNQKVDDFIQAQLDKLNAKIEAKIASL